MARRIAEGVVLLEVAWPEPIGAHAYLIDDGEVTLVDSGLPIPRRPLAAEIRAAGYALGDVDRVLLTHYDVDHVGGLARLDLEAPVYLGAPDRRLVRRSWSPPWRHHKGAFHRVVRRLFPLSGIDLRPVEDGDRIGGFRARSTPGHNPGHTVFLHEGLGTAVLGDLVWSDGDRFVRPPWLDSYDVERMEASIRRVADYEFSVACVGHGPPWDEGGAAGLRALAGTFPDRRP